jgi:AAA+ superfamily predicted ATPase
MPSDPGVIAAILAAVEANPDHTALRLHLASLLLAAERHAEALQHCVIVLGAEPDHLEALQLAVQAATGTGDVRRAESYRRLAQALGGGNPTAPSQAKEKEDDFWPSDLNLSEPKPDSKPTARPEMPPPLRLANGPESFDLAWESEQPGEEFWEAEKPGVTLADVAGMTEVKRRLNLAFLGPLKNPEMMRMYGKSLRGGLLMYGPPGCGKTFIARATAGELGAKFIAVGLSDVLDMWIGASEKNLHEIFESARRNAPCVLFFDEIDALGQKRSLQRHSAARNVVNQLLSEMDSVNANNAGIFVLAATNHPWDVDTALRRPGRLDRTLLVLPPDAAARAAILNWQTRERPLGEIDFQWIANKTADFSGADLVHLVDSAAELAMEDSLTSGRVRPIGQPDFKKALKELKPSTRAWFEVARNYAMFANDGGVYDELLDYLRAQRLV